MACISRGARTLLQRQPRVACSGSYKLRAGWAEGRGRFFSRDIGSSSGLVAQATGDHGEKSLEMHKKMEAAPAQDRKTHIAQQAANFNSEVASFCQPLPNEIVERLQRIANAVPGLGEESRVIDVGSGTGCLIPHLQDRGVSDILAVDVSNEMLAELASRYSPKHCSGNEYAVRTWCGDIVDLPPYMGGADAVLFNAVFGNLWDQRAGLLRASLLLKDGGHVLISHPLGRAWQAKLAELDPAMVPHDLPDEEELQAMVRDLPLKLVKYIDEEDFMCAVLQVPPMYAADSLLRLEGNVVVGFGRGSKQMGVPTANLEPEPLVAAGSLPEDIPLGVYFGWAQLADDSVPEADRAVHPMVMNVGTRPTIEDGFSHITVEAHILHDYAEDFYGSRLRLLSLGFLRPEMRFNGLGELIARIKTDIGLARTQLAAPEWAALRRDDMFD